MKQPRRITDKYIKARFYVIYRKMNRGQKEGVREALHAMDLISEEEGDPAPEPAQQPLLDEADEGGSTDD